MDISKAIRVFEILIFILFYQYIFFLTITVMLAKLFDLKIREVSIFSGPVRKVYKFRAIPVKRRTIPIGVSISFCEKDQSDYYLERFKSIDDLNFWQYAILSYAGCIGLFVFSLIAIGGTATIDHFQSAYVQIYSGALNPTAYGVELISRFYVLHDSSALNAFGILSVKLFALYLVPYIGSSSYLVIAKYIANLRDRPVKTTYSIFSAGILALPLLVPLVGWSIAYVYYLFWFL